MIPANPNIEMLETAARELGPLLPETVFLGGAATGLLLTDPAAPPLRITRDIDVIIEVSSLAAYHRFSEKLRNLGFAEDMSPAAPICRWQKNPSFWTLCRQIRVFWDSETAGLQRHFLRRYPIVCPRDKKSNCCRHLTFWQQKWRPFCIAVTTTIS